MEAGIAAGEHYDPEGHKSHKGPKGKGHKGDLPLLKGNASGIEQTVAAPRLKLADIKGRSLSSTKVATTTATIQKTAAARDASPAASFRSSA